jgi:hypothetical protein
MIGVDYMHVFWIAACFAALSTTLAWAEEPVGCDKFKWPVDREMAALRTPNLKEVKSGTKVSTLPFAGTILLAPSSSASLPKAPERSPKIDTFSGYLEIAGVKAGTYSISLDDAAWVDVVGDNQFLKAKAHSGVQGCQGIRKVLQFELRADPLVVQISGAPTQRLNVAIMPSE